MKTNPTRMKWPSHGLVIRGNRIPEWRDYAMGEGRPTCSEMKPLRLRHQLRRVVRRPVRSRPDQ